jgi:hypothetical protein
MKNSYIKFFAAGSFIILFIAGFMTAAAQETSDRQIPLVRRVMSLMSELPGEMQPTPPEIKLKVVRPGLFAHVRPIFEVASPDGKSAVGTVDGSLYLRQAGSEHKKNIAKPFDKQKFDVEGALWSPDGKIIAVKTID